MAETSEQIADFHVRLGRLEQRVLQEPALQVDSVYEDILEYVAALVALYCCWRGVGSPNHYYQYLFGGLVVAAAYHRSSFPWPKRTLDWLLLVANIVIAAFLFKIIIGGGEPRPLGWLSYPSIQGSLTSFSITWNAAPGSDWALPLTNIQSFFLIVALFGVLAGMSLLSGFASFLLALLAVPSLVSFDWDWALPGMVAGLFTFYLQCQRTR